MLALHNFAETGNVEAGEVEGDGAPGKSALKKQEEDIAALTSNCKQEVAKYQSMVLSTKVIKSKASAGDSKYYEALVADCCKLISQGDKLVKILERLLTTEPDAKEMPKVMRLIADTKAKEELVMSYAKMYGFAEVEKGPKRRRLS